ncbi:MAG: helix-turn-helix domain-containing protein [Treponema sp.]|jgi:transcriptional regulator with XRE-family HTH domain|nr:helix-turn-helix domain-containing protein [Treponema sp.]
MEIEKDVEESGIRFLVSKNLKRLRGLQNISQMDLAINADLTHNFINDIENYKKSISCKTLAKLSTALKVEPYQFFLPETMPDEKIRVYVKDFNDSLQKIVSDLTHQYAPEPSPSMRDLFPQDKKERGK